jgi:hypothetical protein
LTLNSYRFRPVLTTNPRSGTHYLKSLVSTALGKLPLERDLSAPADLRAAVSSVPNNQLIYWHFSFSRHGKVLAESLPGLRMLVLTRHPFDRLISQLAFTKASGGPLPDPNASPQQLARELLLGQWDGKPWSSGLVVNDYAAHHNFLLRDLVTEWLINRNSRLVKFEDLISRPTEILADCLNFIGVALPRGEIAKITERINFMTLSGGRTQGQFDVTSHYRSGIIGEWLRVFSPTDIEILKQKYGDEIKQTGYSL